MADNFIMPSRMDPRRTYVARKRGVNVHYLCTEHGNPLVSVRAESAEGSSNLGKLCVMFEAAPDMLAALQRIVGEHAPGELMTVGQLMQARAAIAKATGKEG